MDKIDYNFDDVYYTPGTEDLFRWHMSRFFPSLSHRRIHRLFSLYRELSDLSRVSWRNIGNHDFHGYENSSRATLLADFHLLEDARLLFRRAEYPNGEKRLTREFLPRKIERNLV